MSELNFTHSNGNKVKLTTPDTLAASKTFKLPGADGSSGQAVVTDGSGALSFADVAYTSPYQFSHWYITSDFVCAPGESDGNSDDVIENWAESNAPAYVRLGTAPTYSSGRFTLPSTGYWKFTAHIIFFHTVGGTGDTFTFSLRRSTDSGSSFNNFASTGGRVDGTTQPNNKLCWTASGIVKIDNASTNRVDVFAHAVASSGGARIYGGTQTNNNNAGAHMTIEKVANL